MNLKTLAAYAAAGAMLAGFATAPAVALSPSEPGYYNDCAAAYVADPALYDRDCTGENGSSLTGPVEPGQQPDPCQLGQNELKFGEYFHVAVELCLEPNFT